MRCPLRASLVLVTSEIDYFPPYDLHHGNNRSLPWKTKIRRSSFTHVDKNVFRENQIIRCRSREKNRYAPDARKKRASIVTRRMHEIGTRRMHEMHNRFRASIVKHRMLQGSLPVYSRSPECENRPTHAPVYQARSKGTISIVPKVLSRSPSSIVTPARRRMHGRKCSRQGETEDWMHNV